MKTFVIQILLILTGCYALCDNFEAKLQARLNAGEKKITIPAGKYRISSLVVPSDVSITGSNNTVLELDYVGKPSQIIMLKGNNISLKKLKITVAPSVIEPLHSGALTQLVNANKCHNLNLSEISFEIPDKLYKQLLDGKDKRYVRRWDVFKVEYSSDVTMSKCRMKNFSQMLNTEFCIRVTVHDCVGRNGIYVTKFSFGSEYLKYYNNWSSNVLHQMFWEGGDCGTAKHLKPRKPRTVIRGIRPGDEGYSKLLTGTYEVMCYANYAEYGKTLCWGRKGRRVLISGNSARFMTDMAYDAEGCEEVVFANNLAFNCKAAGIGCFYYTDAAVITGNVVVIDDVDKDIYKGHFVRMHHRKDVESGKTIITGNLFVNRLAKPRFVKVDKCRDLLISGNKFVNGGIRTNRYGGGNMTFTGNTFISTLDEQETLVMVAKIVKELTMRNNTFINRNPKAKASAPAIDLEFTVTGKLAKERPDAVSVPVYRQLDGNSIRGWKTPVALTVPDGKCTAKVVFINNLYEGEPRFSSSIQNILQKNNIRLDGQK